MTQPKENWEEEFDELFTFRDWPEALNQHGTKNIKSFINSNFISREKVEKVITEEILICHQENTPTSRLTSLIMKLKRI